ncbi:MAG: nucleotidyltransferase domain-containing protein, partial [Chloroflexota bacterium]|nr:nucleotidyltransferase domain-containing protein [Chloroflexota bacterium]
VARLRRLGIVRNAAITHRIRGRHFSAGWSAAVATEAEQAHERYHPGRTSGPRAGVKAVTLGGSRARGMARSDSDWDFGLYYRGSIDADAIRELGYPGQVVEPGDWGRIVNGGAWLEVDGERVDLLYRNLDVVEHWIAEANAGRFEIDCVGGHIAGLPTYTLAGELALGTVLRGNVPRPGFTAELRRTAPPRWDGEAAFSLLVAEQHAKRGEATGVAGLLARGPRLGARAARLTWRLGPEREGDHCPCGAGGGRGDPHGCGLDTQAAGGLHCTYAGDSPAAEAGEPGVRRGRA